MISVLQKYFNKTTETSTLAFFRLAFGLMMLFSIIRFSAYGWIDKMYIQPKFHFTYYGFEWVKPLGNFTYILFFICGLAALLVAIGYRYKIAITVFFLSFTYIELMDKTTYLNHYYFISLEEFQKHVKKGDFIEWEEVYENNYYGTLKKEVERIWASGKNVIFDIDVVGGLSIKNKFISLLSKITLS